MGYCQLKRLMGCTHYGVVLMDYSSNKDVGVIGEFSNSKKNASQG